MAPHNKNAVAGWPTAGRVDGGGRQIGSGPWTLSDKEITAFDTALKELEGFEVRDRNKLSDDDFIMRFLIGRNYDPKVAAESCRKCIEWRTTHDVDNIYQWGVDRMEPDVLQKSHDGICGFYGFDVEGYPVWWERPNQKGVEELMKQYGTDDCIKWHQVIMERIRDHMKMLRVDRFTTVLDLRGVAGISVIMGKVGTLLKAQTKQDQEVYPECMRKMFILQAPFGFSTAYSWIKGFLDKRVQDKIIIDGKRRENDALSKWVTPENIPTEFGGTAEVDWSQCNPTPSLKPVIFTSKMYTDRMAELGTLPAPQNDNPPSHEHSPKASPHHGKGGHGAGSAGHSSGSHGHGHGHGHGHRRGEHSHLHGGGPHGHGRAEHADDDDLLTCVTCDMSTPNTTPTSSPRQAPVDSPRAKDDLSARRAVPPLDRAAVEGQLESPDAATPTVTSPMPLNKDPKYSSHPDKEEAGEESAVATRCQMCSCVVS